MEFTRLFSRRKDIRTILIQEHTGEFTAIVVDLFLFQIGVNYGVVGNWCASSHSCGE